MAMIHSTRAQEGLLTIDHRESPGTTPEQLRGMAPAVAKGQKLECPTAMCNHCQRIVILNPKRNRPRNHCPACHDFMCDLCAGIAHRTLQCVPFTKVIDAMLETSVRPWNLEAVEIVQRFVREHEEVRC